MKTQITNIAINFFDGNIPVLTDSEIMCVFNAKDIVLIGIEVIKRSGDIFVRLVMEFDLISQLLQGLNFCI